MALSDPRIVYGIHSVAPYNRTTGEFYGIAKVLDNSSIAINSELISLTGGSQKFPWAVESGLSTAEISLAVSQYDNFLLEIAYGKAPTANAAEALGSVNDFANKSGVSVLDATTGIASIGPKSGSESDLKFGQYVVKVTDSASDEVTVYASSDVDFNRGTNETYETDLLKIGVVTIAGTGGTADLTGFGLEFTGGSGTIALVDGDTAEFSVRPPNSKSMDVVIGGAADVVPEIGMIVTAQKRGSGEMFSIDIYRAKLTGLPFGFAKSEFSVAEITGQAFYDSGRNGVLSIRDITPV